MSPLVFLLASLLIVALVSSEPVSLSQSDFDSKISEKPFAFVKFFSPRCGWCKRMAPDWVKLSVEHADNENVMIAEVDCTQSSALCQRFGIRGYPTLKYLDTTDLKAYDFRGNRDVETWNSFMDGDYADSAFSTFELEQGEML